MGFNARVRKKSVEIEVVYWPEDCGNRTARSDARMDTLSVDRSTDLSIHHEWACQWTNALPGPADVAEHSAQFFIFRRP